MNYQTIEILLALGILISVAVLFFSGWALQDTLERWWYGRRRRRDFRRGKVRDVWQPSYWEYSQALKYIRKAGRWAYGYVRLLFSPIFKALELMPGIIKAFRTGFDIGSSGLMRQRWDPSLYLCQIYCETCGCQGLGVWLERMPDKYTGEILTNKPNKGVCLKCLLKMGHKTSMYTALALDAQQPPFDEGRVRGMDPDDDYDEDIAIPVQPGPMATEYTSGSGTINVGGTGGEIR